MAAECGLQARPASCLPHSQALGRLHRKGKVRTDKQGQELLAGTLMVWLVTPKPRMGEERMF